mmetsp:Transcript_17974/g.38642  ORF Transcript_17974/g.38642 Transcript_17974/m.38642 type:complete len:134 (+) Transcript_17974:2486-2887(+)
MNDAGMFKCSSLWMQLLRVGLHAALVFLAHWNRALESSLCAVPHMMQQVIACAVVCSRSAAHTIADGAVIEWDQIPLHMLMGTVMDRSTGADHTACVRRLGVRMYACMHYVGMTVHVTFFSHNDKFIAPCAFV